jgi:hypothetical protein
LNRGLEIARVFEATVTGRLRVAAGKRTQTWDVEFLDSDQHRFQLPVGVGLSLEGTVTDPTKGTLTLDGPSAFHLNGVAAGTTQAELGIHHIDHTDFTAAPIPVDVVSPTDAGDETVESPRATALLAPFPNPFNPSTTIRYDVASAAHLRLVIYDSRGRKVQELVNGVQPAGRYALVWHAAEAPSGQYFVRLETPAGTHAARVTLLK